MALGLATRAPWKPRGRIDIEPSVQSHHALDLGEVQRRIDAGARRSGSAGFDVLSIAHADDGTFVVVECDTRSSAVSPDEVEAALRLQVSAEALGTRPGGEVRVRLAAPAATGGHALHR